MNSTQRVILSLLVAWLVPSTVPAQVSPQRLIGAADEPQNWLTYSGSYMSQRYSRLAQVDTGNVKNLKMKWVFQAQSLLTFSTTPLVVDGVMYLTQAPNDVFALDATTGRVFWTYKHEPDAGRLCCRGLVNRGVAISGNTLFMATVDAYLIALDARNGKPIWKTKVAEAKENYGMTLAPLVIKDKVVVGVAGGDFGIRGFIAAYDVANGKECWKFYTVPGPSEAGHDTWGGNSWERGGASVWITGSYDPELNLTYWGVGNPWPDFDASGRPGDNLYSDSVVALDADTGKLKWHFQFSPNDPYDYDSTQIPVLVDGNWNGSPRKLMYWANRNGFFYVLDRKTGEFLLGQPYTFVNWASGLDKTGRPIKTPQGSKPTIPGPLGATNWYSASFSPKTGLFYLSAWENYQSMFGGGTVPGTAPMPGMVRGPINTWNEGNARGVVLAIDPMTGDRKWGFPMHDVATSGVLTTASNLLFVGGREGFFQALDARSGKLLWKAIVGAETAAGPITYAVDGKQYIAIAGGHSLFVFGLD